VTAFCLFVGYGRSGHSAVGSLIDAHARAAVSHELHAVKLYFEGVPRDALFDRVFELAQQQARAGRRSSKAEGGSYLHRIAGQAKRDRGSVNLLGDKQGAATAWAFARHGLASIDEFVSYVRVPVKMLHVIRNPFDVVAAGMARGGSEFPRVAAIVAQIRRRCLGPAWLDVYHERLLAEPRREVARILEFLGLPVTAEHLDRCADYLYRAPRRRRFEVSWSARDRAAVEAVIARHDFLGGYGWDS
jgi:hypothetical protein